MSNLSPATQHPTTSYVAAPVVTYADGRITIDNVPCSQPFKNFDELNKCPLMDVVHGYKHLLSHGTRAGKRASKAMKRAGITLDNELFRLPVTYAPLYRAPDAQLIIDVRPNGAHKSIIRIQDTDQAEAFSAPTDSNAVLAESSPKQRLSDQTRALLETPKDDALVEHLLRTQKYAYEEGSKIPDGFREMTPQEISDYFDKYCTECAQELRQYLMDIYNAALRDGVQPDYFFRIK